MGRFGSHLDHFDDEQSEQRRIELYPMSNEVIHHVLSCGGGVDTTTMFSMHLYRDEAAHWLGITREELDKHLPYFTACVFSDTGSEYPWTYENIDLIKQFCEFHGIVFKQVSRGDYFNDDKSLFEFLTRIGSIPVLPGAPHLFFEVQGRTSTQMGRGNLRR